MSPILLALALSLPTQVSPVTPEELARARNAGPTRHDVSMAAMECRNWAWKQTADRFPVSIGMSKVGKARAAYFDARGRCFFVFRNAGYHLIMEQHDIPTEKAFLEVLGPLGHWGEHANLYRDPVLEYQPRVPFDRVVATAFDPVGVRLSDKDAKWLHWENPKPPLEPSDPRYTGGK